eukprot:gnl/Chilomastix_caulleri/677.p1 GENE.gnl/Chilomastix_caulleri/677~~gnl/Chilomastix_caulleri/677.p1  ORF type:complete len:180 (+),score=43.27 gnl/Chilomastix_caulleri/677:56-595(+)
MQPTPDEPMAKVPPVEMWTKNDVSVWLSSINLRKYSEAFRRNDICGRSLMLIEEPDLIAMNVQSLGDRKALMYEIGKLKDWVGFLWRHDLELSNGSPVALEILLSLAPSKMYAICCIRQNPEVDPPRIPNCSIKWVFTQCGENGERFSTEASYTTEQCRSIIRLPCPIEGVMESIMLDE